MLRSRVEERLGPVVDRGRASLRGYRHCFNKHGVDGTAKGNIIAASTEAVQGVLYELNAAQLSTLTRCEPGYRRIEVAVEEQRGVMVTAVAFTAVAPVSGLRPKAEYLGCYERGMIEHDIPRDYREQILEPAREPRPETEERS
jgi:hypothetical protein